jgi:spore maturation protein CgeB
VSGPGWERLSKRATPLAACVSGSGIWGQAYVETLGGARIGIGLLSKLCQDQFTTRSFEIPAAGALLLAERTEDHLALFEEDKEAVFFSTTHELRQKLRHYLANDTERAAIAERGRQKALACYQWSDVLAPALQEIERLSASR